MAEFTKPDAAPVDCAMRPVPIGARVRLLPPHRHAGLEGVYTGMTSLQQIWFAQVRLDNGGLARVWSNVQWELADGD